MELSKCVKIVLSEKEYRESLKFSIEWYETSKKHLEKRNQTDKGKIISDHCWGKFAEFGMRKFICENLEMSCSEVDTKVVDKSEKSFKADLNTNGFGIHVKSCMIDGWDSWTIQYNGHGRGHKDTILFTKSESDYLGLFYVDKKNYTVYLYSMLNVAFCNNNNLYKLPILKKYHDLKRCVYYDDIKNFDKETQWSFVIQAAKAGLLKKFYSI